MNDELIKCWKEDKRHNAHLKGILIVLIHFFCKF